MATPNPNGGSQNPLLPINDRFITHWADHNDIRAIRCAARNRLVYLLDNTGRTSRPPPSYNPYVPNEWTLEAANQASDEQTRQRHMQDQERDTGRKDKVAKWDEAKRGEKLRWCDARKEYYAPMIAHYAQREQETLTAELDNPLDIVTLVKHEDIEKTLDMWKDGLKMVEQLQELVVEEQMEGWDWEAGIREQVELHAQEAKHQMDCHAMSSGLS